VLTRLKRLTLPSALAGALAPLRRSLKMLTTLLRKADAELHAHAAEDAVVQRLMSAPGVGPVVALSFQATLDTPTRFGGDARRASAFVGLVPSEDSSGERRQKSHITKRGPRELRALLVQASWVIWRGKGATGATLRRWAHDLAARRGRRVAVVALARRLCRILFALWRDATEFREPDRTGHGGLIADTGGA
jgi:transposase